MRLNKEQRKVLDDKVPSLREEGYNRTEIAAELTRLGIGHRDGKPYSVALIARYEKGWSHGKSRYGRPRRKKKAAAAPSPAKPMSHRIFNRNEASVREKYAVPKGNELTPTDLRFLSLAKSDIMTFLNLAGVKPSYFDLARIAMISDIPVDKAMAIARILIEPSGPEYDPLALRADLSPLEDLGNRVIPERAGGAAKPERTEGVVKFYNDEDGYGFIATKDGPDAYLHHSSIPDGLHETLGEGDRVTFRAVACKKGLKAVELRLEESEDGQG